MECLRDRPYRYTRQLLTIFPPCARDMHETFGPQNGRTQTLPFLVAEVPSGYFFLL